MLDGIVYQNDSLNSSLFVTTKKLLGMDRLKPFNANLLDEDKIRKAFFPDSAVIWKESYKEELGRKNGSFLLSVGQDISSQGPNFLLTYFFNVEGDKLAMQIVDLDFPPVPKCEKLFNTDNNADTVKLVAQCYVSNLPAQFSQELDLKSKQSQTELHAVWLN